MATLGKRAIDRWINKMGPGSRTLLFRKTGVSPPTIRKVLRGIAVNIDIAERLAAVVGGKPTQMTVPAKGGASGDRKQ